MMVISTLACTAVWTIGTVLCVQWRLKGPHLVRSLPGQGSEAQLRLAAAAQLLVDLVYELLERLRRAPLVQEEGRGGVGSRLVSCPQQDSSTYGSSARVNS